MLMPLISIEWTPEQFSAELSAYQQKYVLLDFSARWCGPCKRILPEIEILSAEYGAVAFFKVDIDKAQELAEHFNVTHVPTFILMRKTDGQYQTVGSVQGANVDQVRNLLSGAIDPPRPPPINRTF